jgi:DNA-binding NarL/FixJ family response regulator
MKSTAISPSSPPTRVPPLTVAPPLSAAAAQSTSASPPPTVPALRRRPGAAQALKVTRVLLIEDDRAASYSLWALLHWQPGIRICDTAESVAEAFTLTQRRRPEVCLVSAAFCGGEGLDVAHRLTQLFPRPQVLIYASEPQPELDALAMVTGAAGALWRYGEADELAATIRRAAAGQHQPPSPAHSVTCTLLDHLEDRDRPIAAMLILGIPTDTIAGTLGLSARSLRYRRRQILDCLGSRVRWS